ncbi:cyanobactin biosynthesis system PatB/AcyB/McaB family protein [Actinomadura craniellae]|uniref:Cyanobactin biosynthesis system PatB/AcyB/McaB family protein n=1 Tax=Actinomadura craniellae TaxID=2231787 RepID=A0A365GXJ0_9ACTN|nr:cyanobactin biosynthesis system PatB/AcyB/McaB family protein [Actinomadura craniellae]RAY11557.1 cyanobactin biosynthesis system PatB/AcyB/McaB family protein [Actinomadura craniellae]
MTGARTGRADLLPKQAAPVRRPELIHPHRTVDVVHGTPEQLIAMRLRLVHGANFNDPQRFEYPSFDRMRFSMQERP